MASISREQRTAKGKRYYVISVSRGHDKAPYRLRVDRPDGWSDNAVQRMLKNKAGEFEQQCKSGEVSTWADRKANKEAERARLEAEQAKLQTVKQYGDKVFMPHKEQTISENTRTSYRSMLDLNIYPSIGSVLLTEVNPAMCRKVLFDYQKEHAHSSVVKLYVVMCQLFDMAFQDDLILYSPMLKVKHPVPKANEVKENEFEKAYSKEEVALILDCADKEPLKWKLFIYLMNDTWMRRGELCGLQWEDIDFDEKIITVRHNIQYTVAAGAYDKRPKNGKIRQVDFDEDIIPLLKEWHLQTPSRWVFPREDDLREPMFPQDPSGYFKKFSKKYKINGFHPHKLRHTGITIALLNGADITSVSVRAGHSDKAVTLRMYAHGNLDSMKLVGQIGRDAIKATREKKQESQHA